VKASDRVCCPGCHDVYLEEQLNLWQRSHDMPEYGGSVNYRTYICPQCSRWWQIAEMISPDKAPDPIP
jgi:uncharacterized protein YbaR (Trm112 family)